MLLYYCSYYLLLLLLKKIPTLKTQRLQGQNTEEYCLYKELREDKLYHISYNRSIQWKKFCLILLNKKYPLYHRNGKKCYIYMTTNLIYMCVHIKYLSINLSTYVSIYLSIYLSNYLSIYLYIYIYIYIYIMYAMY